MTEKLLPCPFCGGDTHIERVGTPRQSCIVACGECGWRLEAREETSECGGAWNRRAALQSQEPSDEAHRQLKERTEYLLRGHKAIFNQGPKKIDLQKHIKALDTENDRLRALLALIPKENKS